tara:strand:+ start:554 stop:850 length:297 start_codon:yes stop_codon:yes gene_type:complete
VIGEVPEILGIAKTVYHDSIYNPPPDGRISYHIFKEKSMTKLIKTTRQIDADMLCCKCNSKAHIIRDKNYYCAKCECKRLRINTNEYISSTQRPKNMC